jgi:hypothetical protein
VWFGRGTGGAGTEHRNLARRDRRNARPGRPGHRHGCSAALHQHLNGVTLFGVDAAELVLDIDPGLAAHVEQVFALHVEFARQGVDAYFLFLLQAELLCRLSPCMPTAV